MSGTYPAVPEHDGPRAVDHLDQVGDDEHHAMGENAAAAIGAALEGEACSRNQRVPAVVDAGRVGEVRPTTSGPSDQFA
jgi:hypothetical protein